MKDELDYLLDKKLEDSYSKHRVNLFTISDQILNLISNLFFSVENLFIY